MNKDIFADTYPGIDRGESISAMEPMSVSEGFPRKPELLDRAFQLAKLSAGFKGSLPPSIVTSMAALIRSMNCYYSNLIEGHNTHPVDIERALRNDYSADPLKRNLQLEAHAHVTVQRWIDGGGVRGRTVSADSLREIHRRFGEALPPELLKTVDPDSAHTVTVTPGEFRNDDVKVAVHVPVSPAAIPRFIERFEAFYGGLGPAEALVAAAAAHHRILWIHPFLDGNGRVARLMSHAMLLESLDTGGLWSIARGLARNVTTYKSHLMACDAPRRGDLDGRGALSEKALAEFTLFFLDTCVDQVQFMITLVQPDRLRARILIWAEEEIRLGNLPGGTGQILEAILFRGELPKMEAATLIGKGSRQTSRIVSTLTERGVLFSESLRAPLKLAFPPELAGRWLPGLFPEQS